MGLICALVYLLAVINFLPFAFKRHIVEVTSGGGNKDRVLEAQDIENGRFLHKFPLEKVSIPIALTFVLPTSTERTPHSSPPTVSPTAP